MEFMSFGSSNEFLLKFRYQAGDTLILDLNLPGMGGCELLKKLAQEEIHFPVIVVTAFDDPPSREICRQYGVKAYLRKPVDGEALIDIIKYNRDTELSNP